MLLTKLKLVTAALLVVAVFGGGTFLHRVLAAADRGDAVRGGKPPGTPEQEIAAVPKQARTGTTGTDEVPPTEAGRTTDVATVSLLPGTPVTIRPVKAGPGRLIRVELNGLAIEARRLRFQSQHGTVDLVVDEKAVHWTTTGGLRANVTARGNIILFEDSSGKYLGQDDGADPEPAPRLDLPVSRARTVDIPVSVDPVRAAAIQEVILFASANEGQTWQEAGRIAPTQRAFTFSAPGDGVYWFAVQTLDKDGRKDPEDVGALRSGLKIRVDTSGR
jgi:hypothetical protein